MKKIVAALLVMLLLTGCGAKERGNASGTAQQAKTGEYVSLPQELEQAQQVKLELGSEAEAYFADFAAAVELLRDQGLEYLGYGMPRQASWYLSFAGGSVSAVRYAAEQLLGEISAGFSGWDTVGAISLCSPVPFLCEAVAAEQAGDMERVAKCKELAALNPYVAEGFDDFSALSQLSNEGLRELAEGLKAFEEHIYWFYPADPQPQERRGMEWSADYHLSLAAAYSSAGLEAEAASATLDALAADPFSPDVYTACAGAMYEITDIELMQVYVEEGLLINPDHGGLNAMAALLYSGTGDTELARRHLSKARSAELSESEAAVCDTVEGFLKGVEE